MESIASQLLRVLNAAGLNPPKPICNDFIHLVEFAEQHQFDNDLLPDDILGSYQEVIEKYDIRV